MEKYISFNYGVLKFIDSFAFLKESLGVLVENTMKETDKTKEKEKKNLIAVRPFQ